MRTPLAVLIALLLATPLAPALQDPQDDAGSGRDAPDAPDPSFLVETNVVLEGSIASLSDDYDTYGFEGRVGDVVDVRVSGATGCFSLIDPSFVNRGTMGCSVSEANTLTNGPKSLDMDGTWFVRLFSFHPALYRFTIALNLAPRDVSLTGPYLGTVPLAPGADPTCGTGAPVTATSGEGPSGLVYAALKTGFRAVVAWETAEPVAATLTASLDGGEAQPFTEKVPRTQHVFVLDALPEGRSLCFTPQGGSAHALRLANAMNANDGAAYTVNLLVLGNEQPTRSAVENALDVFAESFWDATDGHVRAGRIVALFGDYERHNSGWVSCYLTSIVTGDRPFCQNVYDVIFTYDLNPAAAAATYLDAIREPEPAIWMGQTTQAGLLDLDEPGRVLNHEMGHYTFGAMDLYGTLEGATVGTDPDCWDAAKGLSVMGGERDATEYDDEVNRCPNEAIIEGYVPTWTLLREDFPLVPDRAGVIDAGPAGDGGAYARRSIVVVPQASDVGPMEMQDDAGSGHDAPDAAEDAVRIQPGILYHGLGLVGNDFQDAYALHADAGQRIEVRLDGSLGCYYLHAPSGEQLAFACSYENAPLNTGPLVVLATQGGDHVLRVAHLAPAAYRFGYALDGPAPDVRPFVAPDAQDDAGSGRDAPRDLTVDAPLVEPGRVYSAQSTPDWSYLAYDEDAFRFEGAAGQAVEFRVASAFACYTLRDAAGAPMDATRCIRAGVVDEGPGHAILPATGTYYLAVTSMTPGAYRFGFGLDAPAPELGGPVGA